MSVKVRELRPGKFYIVHHSPEHKHGRKVQYAADTEREAKSLAREYERDLAKLAKAERHAPAQGGPTVREVCESWLRSHREIKPQTRDLYAFELGRRLYPKFGDRPVRQITHRELRDYIGELLDEQGAGRSTVKNLIAPVRQAFEQAVDDGILVDRDGRRLANPAEKLSRYLPSPKRREELSTFLTVSEREAFRAEYKKSLRYHALLAVAVGCGLRVGEVFGLQPGDLNLDRATVTVERTIRDGGKVGSPKSGRTRVVNVPKVLLPVLRAYLAWRAAWLLKLGRGDSPWLFPSDQGTTLHKSSFQRGVFRTLLRRAGIKRRVRFHDLRHTFAAANLEAGASLKYVSQQLGHSSIEITDRFYGHLEHGALRHFADAAYNNDTEGAAVKAAR